MKQKQVEKAWWNFSLKQVEHILFYHISLFRSQISNKPLDN